MRTLVTLIATACAIGALPAHADEAAASPPDPELVAPPTKNAPAVDDDAFASGADATLRLRVTPSHAVVSVDGAIVDVTSGALTLAPGAHAVHVEANAHAAVTMELELGAGEARTVSISLPETGPAPAGPAAEQTGVRLAVYDLETEDVEPRIARIVTEALVLELRKLEGQSVIGLDEVRKMLDHEAEKQMLGCEADESCLAEISGALGVDELVVGQLATLNDERVFTLKRILQAEARVKKQVSRRLVRDDGEEFLAVLGEMVEELFDDRPLRAGETRGVSDEIAVLLNPPPLPTWVFWSTAAVTSASAIGALGLGIAAAYLRYDFNAYQSSGRVQYAESKARADRANYALFAAIGVTGVAATASLATAGVAFFTDWYGYGDQVAE